MSTTTAPQLELFPLTEPTYEPTATLAERFAAFHTSNPHVADALEALAAQWLARHERVSMDALMHRLRWESGVQTTGDVWKLNNSWCAFYVRLMIARRPEWAQAFSLRRSAADTG